MSNSVFLKPDENGNWGKVGTDAAGSMSEQLVFQSGATALGNGTVADVSGYSTLTVDVITSGSATVSFEASNDGTNFVTVPYYFASSPSNTTIASTNRGLRFNVAGFKFFRCRISVFVSGTVDVNGYATTAPLTIPYSSGGYGSSDTNAQSTQNLLGVGAYNLLFDGTNWTRQRNVIALGDGSGTGLPATGFYAYNGTTWDRVRSVNTGQLRTTLYNSVGTEPLISQNLNNNDALNVGSALLGVSNFNTGFAGATWDRVRVGKVYKYIEYLNLANATATTVWTPAAGKKFRLMGVMICIGATNGLVHLRDGAGGSAFFTARDAVAASIHFSFGNGYLSGLADRVLEVYNATGSTINVWVHAWGTEE